MTVDRAAYARERCMYQSMQNNINTGSYRHTRCTLYMHTWTNRKAAGGHYSVTMPPPDCDWSAPMTSFPPQRGVARPLLAAVESQRPRMVRHPGQQARRYRLDCLGSRSRCYFRSSYRVQAQRHHSTKSTSTQTCKCGYNTPVSP